jgi:hypothetical protein
MRGGSLVRFTTIAGPMVGGLPYWALIVSTPDPPMDLEDALPNFVGQLSRLPKLNEGGATGDV